MADKYLTIRLQSVRCAVAEDNSLGGDEFYVVGGAAVVAGKEASKPTPYLTKKKSMTKGDTKQFHDDGDNGGVVFSGNVPAGAFIDLGLEFRDENANDSDFDAEHAALLAAVSTGIEGAVGSLVAPGGGTVAGAIIGAAGAALIKVLSELDEDSTLGMVRKTIYVDKLRLGRNGPYQWHFTDKNPNIVEDGIGVNGGLDTALTGYSNWDYTVTYEIDVARE